MVNFTIVLFVVANHPISGKNIYEIYYVSIKRTLALDLLRISQKHIYDFLVFFLKWWVFEIRFKANAAFILWCRESMAPRGALFRPACEWHYQNFVFSCWQTNTQKLLSICYFFVFLLLSFLVPCCITCLSVVCVM